MFQFGEMKVAAKELTLRSFNDFRLLISTKHKTEIALVMLPADCFAFINGSWFELWLFDETHTFITNESTSLSRCWAKPSYDRIKGFWKVKFTSGEVSKENVSSI
jgi:hypothetical protein